MINNVRREIICWANNFNDTRIYHSFLLTTLFRQGQLNMTNFNNKKQQEKLDYWRKRGAENGYELLSTEYINSLTPLQWRDNETNKIFSRLPNTIYTTGWPNNKLEKNKDQKLKMWQEKGLEHGMKLLSTEIISNRTDLKWADENDNIFYRSIENINRTGWSFIPDRATIYCYWQEEGLKNGYELLSTEYLNTNQKLIWKNIKTGNIIERTVVDIKRSGWPKKLTKDELYKKFQQIAKERGGELISQCYTDTATKLIFKDAGGNIFDSLPSHIINGSWSPYEGNVSENICRQCFEHIFNCKFPINNNIITRVGAKNLQLDGYNDSVKINNKIYKIAFEYQGHQAHRKNEETIKRDQYKVNFCKNNNIILFIIEPFDKFKFNSEFIYNYIFDIISKKLKIKPPQTPFKMDLSIINHSKNMLTKWEQIGKENGFILISTRYYTVSHNLEWRKISNGEILIRSPSNIQKIGWVKNRGV
jgi:hypothetical protein